MGCQFIFRAFSFLGTRKQGSVRLHVKFLPESPSERKLPPPVVLFSDVKSRWYSMSVVFYCGVIVNGTIQQKSSTLNAQSKQPQWLIRGRMQMKSERKPFKSLEEIE